MEKSKGETLKTLEVSCVDLIITVRDDKDKPIPGCFAQFVIIDWPEVIPWWPVGNDGRLVMPIHTTDISSAVNIRGNINGTALMTSYPLPGGVKQETTVPFKVYPCKRKRHG